MRRKRIGIIGGGASGMVAAITAVREGAEVTLLEKNDRIGKKILVTGNGKCNLSNLDFSIEAYHSSNEKRVAHIFEEFNVNDTIRFFQAIGLFIKEKNGYLYPISEQAASVLDVLRYELHYNGVNVVTSSAVTDIKKKEKHGVQVFNVQCCDTHTYEFDSIIIACGSKASPKNGSDGMGYTFAKQFGHTLIRPVPALVQLKCKEEFLKSVAGVRCDAAMTLVIDGNEVITERGELQLTEYGVSGIPIFQLSRFAAYGIAEKKHVQLMIDFMPDISADDFVEMVTFRYVMHNDRTLEEFVTGILNKKLGMLFIKIAGFKPTVSVASIPLEQMIEIFVYMKELWLSVTDTNSFMNAQICAGGINMNEVTDTLESMLVPGLYFAGELLDVDGRCGGYNLQWAWSSGYVAGYHSAQ